jgi:hypothetical protein
VDEIQPVGNVYVILAVPPVEIPVMVPDAEPAVVATPVLLLVHVPPNGDELSDVVCEPQNVVVPVIADGCGLTINGTDVIQPVGAV